VCTKIDGTHKANKIPIHQPTYDNIVLKPFFKTDSIPKRNEESYLKAASSANSQLLTVISEQIKELDAIIKGKNVACLDNTCQDKISESSSSSEEEDEDDTKSTTSDAIINTIQENFEDTPLTINKLKN